MLIDGEELVCKVDPPRSEAEMEALNEDIVEEIPTEEGEEGAEGEEKPAEGSEAKDDKSEDSAKK